MQKLPLTNSNHHSEMTFADHQNINSENGFYPLRELKHIPKMFLKPNE